MLKYKSGLKQSEKKWERRLPAKTEVPKSINLKQQKVDYQKVDKGR